MINKGSQRVIIPPPYQSLSALSALRISLLYTGFHISSYYPQQLELVLYLILTVTLSEVTYFLSFVIGNLP